MHGIDSDQMFIKCAETIMNKSTDLSTQSTVRRFKSLFGICPMSCAVLWESLSSSSNFKGHPHHVLWGLMFLKIYGTEHVHASLAGCHEDTFRKWTWHFIEIVSSMNTVSSLIFGPIFSLQL